jgi:hypothetical protein
MIVPSISARPGLRWGWRMEGTAESAVAASGICALSATGSDKAMQTPIINLKRPP